MGLLVDTSFGELLILPFQPRVPLEERVIWNTDVQPSFTGAEQATQLLSVPRGRFDMDVPVPGGKGAGSTFPIAYGGLKRAWGIGSWHESAVIGSLAAGLGVLAVDTRYVDYRNPGLALIWESSDKWEVVEIDGITDTELSLDGVTANAYRKAIIMPLQVAHVDGNVAASTDGYTTVYKFAFDVEQGKDLEAEDAPEQYEGFDVYWDAPLLPGNSLTDTFNTRVDKTDNETGFVDRYSPWTFNQKLRKFRQLGDGQEETWGLRLWIHRRKGQYRKFWMPTFEHNFSLLSTGALTTGIKVAGISHIELVEERTHLAFELADGSWVGRKIVSLAEDGLGDTNLTLNASLAMDASNIKRISYLGLHRLNEDRLSLRWVGNGVAIMDTTIREIEA